MSENSSFRESLIPPELALRPNNGPLDPRTELTPEEFIQRVRDCRDSLGRALVEKVNVHAADKKYELNISLPSLGLNELAIVKALLPAIKVHGAEKEGELPRSFALTEVNTPAVQLEGDFERIALRQIRAGSLSLNRAMRTLAKARHLSLSGYLTLFTAQMLELGGLEFLGLSVETVRLKHLEWLGCLSNLIQPDKTTPRLLVSGQILTDHAKLAQILRLLCPGTPIYYTGNPEHL